MLWKMVKRSSSSLENNMVNDEFIVYIGNNDFLVTTKSNEKQFLYDFFERRSRDVSNYNRVVSSAFDHGVHVAFSDKIGPKN